LESLATPPSKFVLFVINLDRRPDRLRTIDASLRILDLPYERVPAVDAQAKEFQWHSKRFLSAGLAANWLSHQKAFELFTASTADFALILEDDADILRSKLTRETLTTWTLAMQTHNLSVLQIGFVSHVYRLTRPRGLLDLLLATRAGRVRRDKGSKLRFVVGEFRGGAHAYLVDKSMATELIGANLPPFLSSDNFFESLARHGGAYRIARLFRSAVEQESRLKEGQLPDSDV